jgi:hypothetical protein
VTVADPCTGRTTTALVVFDPGSTHTYITEKVIQQLGKKPEKEIVRSMGSFNSASRATSTVPQATLRLNYLDGDGLMMEIGVLRDLTATLRIRHVLNHSLPDYTADSLDIKTTTAAPSVVGGEHGLTLLHAPEETTTMVTHGTEDQKLTESYERFMQ